MSKTDEPKLHFEVDGEYDSLVRQVDALRRKDGRHKLKTPVGEDAFYVTIEAGEVRGYENESTGEARAAIFLGINDGSSPVIEHCYRCTYIPSKGFDCKEIPCPKKLAVSIGYLTEPLAANGTGSAGTGESASWRRKPGTTASPRPWTSGCTLAVQASSQLPDPSEADR